MQYGNGTNMNEFRISAVANRSLTPSPNRRSSTTVLEHSSRFSYCSPQPSRRYSNPTANTNMVPGFRTRSPSDPQTYLPDPPPSSRRFSQPASPSGYGLASGAGIGSLIRRERESYSSLNYLPEVRTYLQFMEDSTLPHRSNSFSGRNSSRRSSYNRRRRASSRPRTPTPTPMACYGDEQDSAFIQSVTNGPVPFYGRYLTPQRSGSISDQQQSPNTRLHYESLDHDPDLNHSPPYYGYGNFGVNGEAVPETPPPTYSDTLNRRRSSTIRTTFI